ncbi:hypothetical protein [Micromonospora ureilytica]|uniref:hypothetical protein n=1 Tax=Micromonospora ureilytica TaxID=709868 RepID=UPI00403A1531
MSTDASIRAADTRAEARALSAAVAAAGHAPSIHNTQPWRWRLTSNELDLYLDHSRGLEITDPDSRLAVLSCGAALHHALVSLAAAGWHTLVARMPNPAHPDHLARLRVDERIPVTPAAVRHRQTVALRHTDRRPVVSAPVVADKLHSIVTAVESVGAHLHLLQPDQVYDLATAVDHAQRAEADEVAWQAEVTYWTGGTRPLGTGIPDSAIGDRAPQTTASLPRTRPAPPLRRLREFPPNRSSSGPDQPSRTTGPARLSPRSKKAANHNDRIQDACRTGCGLGAPAERRSADRLGRGRWPVVARRRGAVGA